MLQFCEIDHDLGNFTKALDHVENQVIVVFMIKFNPITAATLQTATISLLLSIYNQENIFHLTSSDLTLQITTVLQASFSGIQASSSKG